jgi:hypothetical protein
VFAIYHLPGRKSNPQYLGLTDLFFKIKFKGKDIKIPLVELRKIVLEKRRKLAPLIIGGIITSLSMLSIILFSSGLEVVSLVGVGLLLTYYGMQEYVVIQTEYSNHKELTWLPLRVDLASVRPFIALIEFYISRQIFPTLYASRANNIGSRIIHNEAKPVLTDDIIYYRFRFIQSEGIQTVAVNPTLLDAPISIEGENNTIGQSEYLVNSRAVVEAPTVSYS